MRKAFLILFHACPLVPLAMGRYYLGVAALLLIALPYIKAKKLEQKIANLNDHPFSLRRTEELKALGKIYAFWKNLTFLP